MQPKRTRRPDDDVERTDRDLSAPLPVRRIQSSYHQVADQLRSLITTGDLGVGERLPSEAEMAPLFGVSRSTIREALRILVTDGLLVTRRGVQGGTFVAELDPGRVEAVLNDAFHILAVTDRVSASDFLDAWRAIEVPAAGLAARRRGGDALGRLAAATEPVGPDQPRPKRLRHSQDFHFALLNASGNLLLEAMGRPVSAVAQARFSQTAPTDEFWTANTDEHRRIYEAIAAGDADRAQEEAAHHIEALREYYARSGVSAVQAGAPTRRNTTRRRSKSSPIVPAGGSPRT